MLALPRDRKGTLLPPLQPNEQSIFFPCLLPPQIYILHYSYYSNNTTDSLENQDIESTPDQFFSFQNLTYFCPYLSRIFYLKTIKRELHGVGVSHFNQESFRKMHTCKWELRFLWDVANPQYSWACLSSIMDSSLTLPLLPLQIQDKALMPDYTDWQASIYFGNTVQQLSASSVYSQSWLSRETLVCVCVCVCVFVLPQTHSHAARSTELHCF